MFLIQLKVKFSINKKLLSKQSQEVMLDKHYILQNMGLSDFELIPQTKLKIITTLQKVMNFLLLPPGKLEIVLILKKNTYKKESIQREWKSLMAKYTKLLRKFSAISDPIFLREYCSYFNLIFKKLSLLSIIDNKLLTMKSSRSILQSWYLI